jgi:hypothetical protein
MQDFAGRLFIDSFESIDVALAVVQQTQIVPPMAESAFVV